MHFDRNPFMCSNEGGKKKALMISNVALSLVVFPVTAWQLSMAVIGLSTMEDRKASVRCLYLKALRTVSGARRTTRNGFTVAVTK